MSKKNTTPQDGTAGAEGAPVIKPLKAERVQEPLAAQGETLEARLKAERVQERLQKMPGWKLVQGGRGIDRVKSLGTAECAADYAGFVLRQAARNQQVVRVELRGARILLAVFAEARAGGLTDKHLDFAAALG